jgi:hypothetical protein
MHGLLISTFGIPGVLALFLTAVPVVLDRCGNENRPATCRNICSEKLKKEILHAEFVGTTGPSAQRVCACYAERIIVLDGTEPPTPEKP